MKILITGGCGFIGSSLCEYLFKNLKNPKILSVDNLYKKYSKLNQKRLSKFGIKNKKINVFNKKKFLNLNFKPDLIIDCSAEPAVEISRNDIGGVLNSNLFGTFNILEKARINNSKLIFLSSSRIYPIKESYIKFKKKDLYNEKTPINGPKTIYGFSKLASEMIIEEYNYSFKINYIINRLGLVTGSWQFGKVEQGLVSLWLWNHYTKNKLYIKGYKGSGKQIRDVLFINDVCELILKQINNFNKCKNKSYTIGGGLKNSINLNELTKICSKITNNRLIKEKIRKTSIYDIPYFVSSNKKIKKDINWKPKIKIYEGLVDMHKWMKNNYKNIKKFF